MGSTEGQPLINILYVDDEPDLLEIGQIYLEKEGKFKVDTLTSANDALDSLKTKRYDAIVSDYQMPMMDGIDFLKELKSSGDHTPFIIFTGRGREDVVIEALNNGADFYIQKGGDPKSQFAELSNKISYAVTRKHAEESLEMVVRNLTLSQQVAHVGNWMFDIKNQVFEGSDETTRLFGYPASYRPSYDEIASQIHPDDYPEIHQGFTRLIETGEPYNIDFRIYRHDTGEMRFMHSKGQMLKFENGEPASVFGINMDITDHKLIEEELIRKNEELEASYEQITATEDELRANLDEIIRQEHEIRESEERYHQFFKTTLDSVFMTTPDGKWVDCNDALVEICGYESREDVFSVPVSSFYAHPEEREEFLRIVEEKGYVKEHPLQFRRKDGTTFGGLITIVPQKNRDGSIKGFIGTVHDVTRRKQAEKAVIESEERYRNIFESLEDLYYQTDPNGIITLLSPSVYHLSGWKADELIGKQVTDLYVNPNDREILLEEIEKKGYVRDYELLLLKQDGTETPVSVSAGFITRPDGTPAGIRGSLRDITDRKRAEEALRESEEKFRELFNNATDAIVIHDIDGRFLEVNDIICKRLGYSRKELMVMTPSDIDAPEYANGVPELINRVQKNNFLTFETVHLTKNGRRIPVEVSSRPIKYQGKMAILSTARDITERKQAEEALRQVNRKLNILSSITRHDIKNSIMVANGYLDLIRDADPAEQEEYLYKIHQIIQKINRQIEFTRLYDNLGSKDPIWLNLRQIVQKMEVPESVSLRIKGPDVEIFADMMLWKVFENLLEDSLMHGQHVTEIQISSGQSDGGLNIVWEDNGIGIPLEEKKKIFEKGFGKNTGLGLFLSREILSITGIKIEETGEPGKGARFEMKVPEGVYRINQDTNESVKPDPENKEN